MSPLYKTIQMLESIYLQRNLFIILIVVVLYLCYGAIKKMNEEEREQTMDAKQYFVTLFQMEVEHSFIIQTLRTICNENQVPVCEVMIENFHTKFDNNFLKEVLQKTLTETIAERKRKGQTLETWEEMLPIVKRRASQKPISIQIN